MEGDACRSRNIKNGFDKQNPPRPERAEIRWTRFVIDQKKWRATLVGAVIVIMEDLTQLPNRSHPAHCPPVEKFNCSVIVFLTVCSKDRKNIFANKDMQSIICEAWSIDREWIVGRYVLMPDHVHLFCAPSGLFPDSLRKWTKKWKSYVSRKWPRPGEHPIWQTDFWDTQLRSGESYQEKWKYVKDNPVRGNLCEKSEEWPYQGMLNKLNWYD